MKQLIIPLLLAGSYRAGCVAAGGAAVVGRLLPVLLLSRHGGQLLFAAGCADNPMAHQLKTCRVTSD